MLVVGSLFRSSEWCSARHVLHARTDRDVYVSDLVAELSDCVSLAQGLSCHSNKSSAQHAHNGSHLLILTVVTRAVRSAAHPHEHLESGIVHHC